MGHVFACVRPAQAGGEAVTGRAFAHLCGLMIGVALLTVAAWDVVHTPDTRWRVQVIDVCEVNPAAQRCQEWKPFPEIGR
jgi:hypothetical protein